MTLAADLCGAGVQFVKQWQMLQHSHMAICSGAGAQQQQVSGCWTTPFMQRQSHPALLSIT